MTFCFAFSANPDGIAVVADTRLSRDEQRFSDGHQKVIFPTEDSFIAISGVWGPLTYILRDIGDAISPVPLSRRIDFLRTHLRQRYVEGLEKRSFAGSPEDANLIYGDVRFHKGANRTRLVRLCFQFESGTTVFGERSAPNFGWQCIGVTPALRKFLANAAVASLQELDQRGLTVRSEPNSLHLATGRAPHQSLYSRGFTFEPSASAAIHLDSSGPRDGTFMKTLRAFTKANTAIEPIQVLGGAALQAIADQVAVFRNPPLPGIEAISDTWSLATISRRNGIRLYTGDDPNGVMALFGLSKGLS
jgi:hypothetical protein